MNLRINMTRFNVKHSRIAVGNEYSFRQIASTYDSAVTASTQLTTVFKIQDIDLSEATPAYERDQPSYIGNTTRLPSYTEEGGFANGNLEFSGRLHYGGLLNLTLGPSTTADGTQGYQEFGLSGLKSTTTTGLSTTTQYYFKVAVDGAAASEFDITTDTDVTYAAIIALLNAAVTTVTFALTLEGDLRCTSDTLGATSAVAITAGTTGTDLLVTLTGFTAMETAVAGSANYEHSIAIGDRPTFFAHYEIGNVAVGGSGTIIAEDLLGCAVDELTLSAKENAEVEFSAKALVAKKVSSTTFTSPSATLSVPYMHWKHVAFNLRIGDSVYTSSTQNYVESFKINIKNNLTYKTAAPSSGGLAHANFYKEGLLESSIDFDIYPEDNQLWELGPHDSMYADKATSSTIDLYVTFKRSSTDYIRLYFEDLTITKISKKIPAISDGIIPASVTLKPAQSTSVIRALCVDNINHATNGPYNG